LDGGHLSHEHGIAVGTVHDALHVHDRLRRIVVIWRGDSPDRKKERKKRERKFKSSI
jgi:hypothetical protein